MDQSNDNKKTNYTRSRILQTFGVAEYDFNREKGVDCYGCLKGRNTFM